MEQLRTPPARGGARATFKDGRPEGCTEDFATGFRVSAAARGSVGIVPAALAVTKDGSLLVADDTGGTIWRHCLYGQARCHRRARGRTARKDDAR